MSTLGDSQLWPDLQAQFLRYRQGDGAAARQVFTALLGLMRRYFRVRVGSGQDAEDLAQACLLKLHLGRDRFAAELSLKTWVYTVASRCLIDHWRGSKHRDVLGTASDGVDAAAEVMDPALPVDLRLEYGTELEAALATLKPLDRAIVYLYGVEGLSMAEVAAVHGLTPAATKVRAHRAYVKLRELMA